MEHVLQPCLRLLEQQEVGCLRPSLRTRQQNMSSSHVHYLKENGRSCGPQQLHWGPHNRTCSPVMSASSRRTVEALALSSCSKDYITEHVLQRSPLLWGKRQKIWPPTSVVRIREQSMSSRDRTCPPAMSPSTRRMVETLALSSCSKDCASEHVFQWCPLL